MSGLDLRPAWPAAIVAVTALAVLMEQAFAPRDGRARGAGLSLFGLVAALGTIVHLARSARGTTLAGSLSADELALYLQGLVVAIGILVVLLSPAYLREAGMARGEYYALTLFSMVGMMGLVSSLELISMFVTLEIMSVALYALAGMRRDRPRSQEAALKYFVAGAFSSAFLLYGVALLYGVSGSTSIPKVAGAIGAARGEHATLALLGMTLVLVGFGFKVASVPFHMWAPDVYEGAPTTVTALMSAGVKAAAFGALLRVLTQALPTLGPDWRPVVAVLAALSMVGGNLGALSQTSVKRLLAFSSIAHAGYVLTALVAAPETAATAALFYLAAYGVVNVGAFGALAALARDGGEPLVLSDLEGLGARRPALAAMVTVFVISLTGVPVSAGFVGKFYLFSAAVKADYVGLALIGVVMSVVSAYYYLGIVVAMYMKDTATPPADDGRPLPLGAQVALWACAALVLGLGIYPAPLLELARMAGRAL